MKTILKVVKIGGNLIEDQARFSVFLDDFSKLKGPKILVHGGGNKATEIAARLGVETQMIDGRRITDKDSMEVICMVYGGLINKKLVSSLQTKGQNSIGLCGADAGVLISEKRAIRELDYGYVGDIIKVNTPFLTNLLKQQLIPVFSAISYSEIHGLLNTNGDSVASEIAIAMSDKYETELYFCSEKKGVLRDVTEDNSVIPELNSKTYQSLKEKGIITDGMLPKLHNCFQAMERGVSKVLLGDHQLLKPDSLHTKIEFHAA